MDIALTLLGPPQIELAGASPPRLGAKSLALLAFLVLEPGPHGRDELAALLWSDSAPDAARASLRQALHQLRSALGEVLEISRHQVALAEAIRCDVLEFLACVARAPEEAAGYAVPRFLTGFDVPRAAAFEDWREAKRAELLGAYRTALRRATRHAIARSRWRDAIACAERWVAHDPLSDEATRLLVEALYMAGDRGEALARYEAHRRRLREETGAEESAPLRELARRIAHDARVPEAATGEAPLEAEALPADFEPALVGREAEWQRLTHVWREVIGGAGRTILLEGEAGAGKTRLVDDFLDWTAAEGATVLRSGGYDPGGGVAFAPIAELLRHALDRPGLPGTAPEWLAEVSRILPQITVQFRELPEPAAPGDTDRRWRLFEGIAQLVSSLAAERPTVLCLDDLHRCDAETCALMHFLTRRLERAPVLLLLTATLGEEDRGASARFCRALRAGGADATVLRVGPLDEEHVREIIRELGRVADPDGARRFAAQIHAVTDGNPFHVLELLKALFAQGILTTDPETGEWLAAAAADDGYRRLELPRTIRDAVAERYRRLPYELRDLLATVAAAGLGVSAWMLSYVHGISRLRAAALADALVERRLLAAGDGLYRCAHPIILDVVRAALTPARRQELHRIIAEALAAVAADGQPLAGPGEVARHAERGGDRGLAHRAAMQASEEATTRRAWEEALSWLDLAARMTTSQAESEAVNARTAAILDAAGWAARPATARVAALTPARGIARPDLDLRSEDR